MLCLVSGLETSGQGVRKQCFGLATGWSSNGTEQMDCATCGHSATRVVDSRVSSDAVRRRRCCALCGTRFTTYERVYNPRLMVEKRNGMRESFSLEKLEHSISLACAKRPLPIGAIEQLAVEVQEALADDGKEVVASSLIGEMVLLRLKVLDSVAYMRFASVYRDFNGPERFVEELEDLISGLPTTDRNQARLMGADALTRFEAQLSK